MIPPARLEDLRLALQDDNTQGVVEDSPLMRLLVPADGEPLSHLCTEKLYQAGEVVFQESDPGDEMFLIRAGQVAVFRGELEGPAILAYRHAGEIIGEMALLDDRPRSASVVALEPLRLLSINRQCFEDFLIEIPAVGRYIMGILSARLRHMAEAPGAGRPGEKGDKQPAGGRPAQPGLRIELDEARQQKQVAEVTESEYFLLLQNQARDLRGIIDGADE